jgi:hypothetical protein
MAARFLLGIVLALCGCGGGGTYFTTLTATPAAAPPDVFDCARSQLAPLGYQQKSYDIDARRLVATKVDRTVHRANRQFLGLIDQLIIEVQAGGDGATSLKVEGHTFGDFSTVRGPTQTEEAASEGVKAAARAMIETCGK